MWRTSGRCFTSNFCRSLGRSDLRRRLSPTVFGVWRPPPIAFAVSISMRSPVLLMQSGGRDSLRNNGRWPSAAGARGMLAETSFSASVRTFESEKLRVPPAFSRLGDWHLAPLMLPLKSAIALTTKQCAENIFVRARSKLGQQARIGTSPLLSVLSSRLRSSSTSVVATTCGMHQKQKERHIGGSGARSNQLEGYRPKTVQALFATRISMEISRL